MNRFGISSLALLCIASSVLPSKAPSVTEKYLGTITNALIKQQYGFLEVLFTNLPAQTVKRTLTHVWAKAILMAKHKNNPQLKEAYENARALVTTLNEQPFTRLLEKQKIDDSWLRSAFNPQLFINRAEALKALGALKRYQDRQEQKFQINKNLILMKKSGQYSDLEISLSK